MRCLLLSSGVYSEPRRALRHGRGRSFVDLLRRLSASLPIVANKKRGAHARYQDVESDGNDERSPYDGVRGST